MNTVGSVVRRLLHNEDPGRARSALFRRRQDLRDLALLLSPGGGEIVEEMAETARRVTVERFGKTVQLYAPVYLTNSCVGKCPYCGFRADQKIERRTLSPEETATEVSNLQKQGISHVLLVAGDAPAKLDIDTLFEHVLAAVKIVPSVALEVAPLSQSDYERLAAAGVDGITLYQEAYDRERYMELHSSGPKADYDFRRAALDRAGKAKIRKLVIGALWGLAPWRSEALAVGEHAVSLMQRWWKSQVSIGLPRLHQVPDDFVITHSLDDRALIQIISAFRVFLPDAGLVLSTRERPELRDVMAGYGITQMSAGSKTSPGGYSVDPNAGEQFAVTDQRSPVQIAQRLLTLGFDPVFKDWDRILCSRGCSRGGV
jgi:2-iminoacetate synthase